MPHLSILCKYLTKIIKQSKIPVFQSQLAGEFGLLPNRSRGLCEFSQTEGAGLGKEMIMPAGTGDVGIILTLPIMLVGGITAGITSYFGAPDWGIWVAGVIGAGITLIFMFKWIPYNDG